MSVEEQGYKEILNKLRAAKLKLNPIKCNLLRCEISYLGHIICAEGVKIDPDTIAAVDNWSCPVDHQLQNFLELCTYNCKFVKRFSNIAWPLHKLSKAHQKFL